jgi:glyoxylase-like metal-dependent hydrolase (beta-lactamase superfamily II)
MLIKLIGCLAFLISGITARSASVDSLRLYIFDCGTIVNLDLSRFRLQKSEVAAADLAVPCFLVCHPNGLLLWETGAVPDSDWEQISSGADVACRVVLPDSSQRDLRLRRKLLPQLREAGFTPDDITFLAFSHYHWDHTGNANAFKGATWLVRLEERNAMFATPSPAGAKSSYYAALRERKTVPIESDEHDVFGDGTVILKRASGHTPGHQVLFVNLPKTGPIVLSGDLYHFAASRALGRIPMFDADQAATAASRQRVEDFLERRHAQLWIQHDAVAFSKWRKAPQFYE